MCTLAPAIGLPLAASVTVPVSTPVGPRGDWSTAAKASSLPWPHTLLLAAVPPQLRSDMSCAVLFRMASVAPRSPISDGAADHISATVPTRCGLAIEVPLSAPYAPPGREERTSTPGADRFGLIRPVPVSPGPRAENDAMLPLMSKAPEE